jgi:predicted ATPase
MQTYIRGIKLNEDIAEELYPFNIPAVRAIDHFDFRQPVTFLIGENGSGKSTILEALAVAIGFNPEGGTKSYSFATANTVSKLHDSITVVREPVREREGFFLRAESFYNVSTEASRLGLQYGDKALHDQSHGESFLSIANYRFAPKGLYILDEPEAALSPQRQLAFLARIHDLVQHQSQFIIATHSPILWAYPQAKIYELSQSGIRSIEYEKTGHYRLTLDFLTNHKIYVNKLFTGE